jgi:hypothetical protein
MGGNATLQATVVGEVFGRGHYGAIAGRMSPVIVTLQALGVPFVGSIHDRTVSYQGILAHIAVHPPRRRLRAWDPRAAQTRVSGRRLKRIGSLLAGSLVAIVLVGSPLLAGENLETERLIADVMQQGRWQTRVH